MPPIVGELDRLTSLQYELALRVGLELQLVPMLRRFFTAALKSLGCKAAHVWLRAEQGEHPRLCFSYPTRDRDIWQDDPRFGQALNQLQHSGEGPRSLQIDSVNFLLLMPMGQTGFCVILREGSALDETTVSAIRPIFERLTNACRASLRHEKVEQLQALAAERELRLRTVMETIGEVIFQADGQGKLSFLNPAWEALTGIAVEQALQRSLIDFMATPDRAALQEGLAMARKQDHGERLELRLETADGSCRDVVVRIRNTRATPSRNGPTKPDAGARQPWQDQVTGTIIDVTEMRRAERLKREFTATVSHELRTPLTSIIGAISLLNGAAGGDLPAKARELITIAEKNSARLRRLIDDLLDMEKLLSGKMRFALTPLDPSALISQAIHDHAPLASQRQIELKYEQSDPVRPVRADPHRFEQVLSNLLSNAIKFSPRGGRVEIHCRARETVMRIEVVDHGPGIDPAVAADLFEAFTQADASDTREQGGTGLGLAISRALLEQMGGQVGVDSRLGAGATFWFELPLAVMDASD